MLLSELTKYLKNLSYEKQMIFSALCSKRCLNEVENCFPEIHPDFIFSEVVNKLWLNIINNKFQYDEVWRTYDLKIFKDIEPDSALNPSVIGQLARTLNLAIAAIDDKRNSAKLVANCADNASQIMSIIYEDYDKERQKETKWQTEALYLISKNEKLITNYSFFTDRIPEYDRSQISIHFKITN